ncbi:MAG: IS1182 family transposase [Pseudobdellovibrionaceae bacterium]
MIKKHNHRQTTFFDSDYYCGSLIPKTSFFRRFRDLVGPLITDEMFSDLYCGNNGRPPISPSLLAKAMLLQYHMNLSDREIERTCQFDLEVKFALGLRIDARPFDHSSLGDFRERLLKSGREKNIFDQIVDQLIKAKLISRNEIQRIDATHIIADIALPSMVGMVKKGSFEVLKKIKVHYPKVYNKVSKRLSTDDYCPGRINDDGPGRFSMEKRAERLVKYVEDARFLLKEVKEIEGNPEIKTATEILKTLLQENIDEDTVDGKPIEIEAQKKPKNRMVSPIDPDAKAGAKSKFKKFIGYKTSITQEVKNQFITNVDVMGGNRPDSDPTVAMVEEQILKHDLLPKKLIGDTAYGDGIDRRDINQYGSHLIAPFKEANPRTKAVFPKTMFKINRSNNTLTCPTGAIAKAHFYDSANSSMIFHFPHPACGKCHLKSQCTKAKEGRRTVRIYDWQEMTNESHRYNLTDEFKKDMKLRQPIEGKFSEMKRLHGLTRTRYRGLKKVGLQCFFTATVVNVKRWIKLEYAAA